MFPDRYIKWPHLWFSTCLLLCVKTSSWGISTLRIWWRIFMGPSPSCRWRLKGLTFLTGFFSKWSVSLRTLFWTASSHPPRASQSKGDNRFSPLQVTNYQIHWAGCEFISLGADSCLWPHKTCRLSFINPVTALEHTAQRSFSHKDWRFANLDVNVQYAQILHLVKSLVHVSSQI